MLPMVSAQILEQEVSIYIFNNQTMDICHIYVTIITIYVTIIT